MREGAHKIQETTRPPARPTPSGQSDWQQAARDALAEMEHLEKGWDSYDADPPTAEARMRAQEVVDRLSERNLQSDNVVPSAIGGVGFNFRRNGNYCAIEIDNDELILLTTLNRQKKSSYWECAFSSENVLVAIEKIQQHLSK